MNDGGQVWSAEKTIWKYHKTQGERTITESSFSNKIVKFFSTTIFCNVPERLSLKISFYKEISQMEFLTYFKKRWIS